MTSPFIRWVAAAIVCACPLGAQPPHPPGWNPTDSIRQLATYRPAHDTLTLLAPARIARLPHAEAEAWRAYVARSRAQYARDTASMGAELRALGRDTMSRAPYTHDFDPQPTWTPAWFASDSARRIADAVLSYQAPNGGWSKHVDFTRGPRQHGQSYFAESNEWAWIATLDNGGTTDEIRFLARANSARRDPRYEASIRRGIDYLLASQMPNGCWPQSWPLEGSYHDAATFNDGAMVNALRVLGDAASDTWAYVPNDTRVAARAAVDRGIACVLRAQVVVNGTRTVWGQQHDPLTLAPTSARSYELTSLTSLESALVMDYLMSIASPSAEVVRAVHAAADWFRTTAMRGYVYEKYELRASPNAGPLWPRLAEIGTNRPIFANRDGVLLYDFDKLTDRRRGYGWFTLLPAASLARYDAWTNAHPR